MKKKETNNKLKKTKNQRKTAKVSELDYQIKTLNEIGHEIISSLSVEKIIEKTYKKVNSLMDASVFMIGIYNRNEKRIDVSGSIEKGKKLPSHFIDLADTIRPAVWCFKNQKEMYTNDYLNDYAKYFPRAVAPKPATGEQTKSLIYLPLSFQKKKIGVISVQSFKKNAYTQFHLDILRNLTVYITTAIENAQLYEDMETKVKERTNEIIEQKEKVELSFKTVKTLSEIGQEITSILSAEKIIEKTYKKLNSLLDASVFTIGLYNREAFRLDASGSMEKGEKKAPFFYNLTDIHRPAVWCFLNQKEIVMNDFNKDYNTYFPDTPIPKPVSGEMINSMIYLPLTFHKKRIGVISVQSFKKNAYTQYHIDIIRNLSVYISTALENARLYHNVETEIKERTEEIVEQKEELEKNSKALEQTFHNITLLGEIGQKITSTLDIERILEIVYENINALMDATEFGIGIIVEDRQLINMRLTIYEEKKVIYEGESNWVPLNDKRRLSVWCVDNKKEVFINDMLEESKNYIPSLSAYQTKQEGVFLLQSLICLPLIIENKVIGISYVQSKRKDAYTPMHLEMLKTIASYTAVALNNSEAYKHLNSANIELADKSKQLEQSYNNITLLSEIGKQIASSLSVEKIIETAYENINKLMDASSFWIGIYNEKTQQLDYPLGKEEGKTHGYAYYDLSDDKWLPVWSFKKQQVVFVNDYESEYNNYIPDSAPPKPIAGKIPQSSIWYPLVSKDGKPLGIITIQSFHKHSYTEYHLSIVKSLAVFTSIALENALIHESVEQKVKEQTGEVVKQKEEIELSYKNIKTLSEIGQEITSLLSAEKIIEKTYKKVNSLMDASVFGIGLYNPVENIIHFHGSIEKGEKLPPYSLNLDGTPRPGVWCFMNQKEMMINDFLNEYNTYFPDAPVPQAMVGEQTNSLIYLPLSLPNKKIGLITVQSFKKNAYSQYHLDILRTLRVYITTALENAQLYESVETKVKERTSEVMRQQAELEQMNKEITDSINYARTIQEAILPFSDRISQSIKDFFIHYQPKAIVSGDFYWFTEVDGKQIMAAADCTGHGVPGAFMSMIGNDMLNDIVNRRGITRPDLILNELHKGIRYVLKQEQTLNQDGMDIALVEIDKKNKKIYYAGAKNPLIYVCNNECFIVKADKIYIGGTQQREEQERLFKLNEIELSSEMMIYLFSDGMADQFGGPKGKKFKQKQLMELLLANSNKPLEEQKNILDKTFVDWKGNLEQVDDVLVIGIRIMPDSPVVA
jgi:transcriptional regulator with GAF, ATPase, and Fis domain